MSSEKIQPAEQEKYDVLAKKLMELQAVENDGRGVNCVRDVASFLSRGDLRSARAIADWDGDKIVSYPPIAKVIREELFEGVELPPRYWSKEEFKKKLDSWGERK